MIKQVVSLSAVIFLSIVLFISIFKLLQNERFYSNTLGLVSQNYERSGGWDDFTINKVNIPYTEIRNESFLQWDADIYHCIKERGYVIERACYGKVRAAFFPLFPFFWKILGASPAVISLVNYLLFAGSLLFLVLQLSPQVLHYRASTFILLLMLPTNVIYMIPYSEGLFMFCMTILASGVLKKKYYLYFIGAFLLALVRPATLFVLLAIVSADLLFMLKHGDYKSSATRILSKVFPFILGYIIVSVVQFSSSGSWSAFFDAQKFWAGGIQSINSITDWSVEGFGMNSFSILFVGVPSIIFLIYALLRVKSTRARTDTFFEKSGKNFLLFTSLFYFAGILIFSILTSGGNFHSLFRFILCSPLFFIAVLLLIPKAEKADIRHLSLGFGTLSIALLIYLMLVEYGGDRTQFAFFGLLMLFLTTAYVVFRKLWSPSINWPFLFLLVLLNTIWNTYLLNMFFNNAWIFT